jgi:hypothetical protein
VSLLSEDERALVASQVAALRKRGWPASRAVDLVARRLRRGPLQDQLVGVSTALWRGERALVPPTDPLLALLSRGDAAGFDALDEAVRGMVAISGARRAMQTALLPTLAFALGALALATLVGWLLAWVHPFEAIEGIPWLTRASLAVLGALRFAGPVLMLLVAGLAALFRRRWMPGLRPLRAAGLLRQYAAACQAGVDEVAAINAVDVSMPPSIFASRVVGLDPLARAYGERWMARKGSGQAARRVAEELEAQGLHEVSRFQTWAPVAVLGLWVALAIPVVTGLYIPLFTLAVGTR